MEIDRKVSRPARWSLPVVSPLPRLLLVDGDLGRRATLAVALGTRYVVSATATPDDAYARATASAFDLAVLETAVLEARVPRLVRVLRGRSRSVRLVVVTGRRDLRGRHYAATLGIDGVVRRSAPAHALMDRIDALTGMAEGGFDRAVGRAMDLIARDVSHLLDIRALAEATGGTLSALATRFRAAIGLDVHEYVTRVRVAVAEQLLRDTALGVGDLAELLGFADAAELARAAALTRPQP